MNLNFEQARDLMVENQLRPNKIREKAILNLFKSTPKENFVPENYKKVCYFDKDLNILDNRGYLKNLHLAQIIHNADIKKNDNVLHIGGLTGYLSIIISQLCNQITVLEEDKNILINLEKNISSYNLNNIKIINTKLEKGSVENAPYDTIIIDCPIYNLNKELKLQLNPKQGKLIYIAKFKDSFSKAYKIIRNNNHFAKQYLFDVFSNFSIDESNEDFKF